MHIVIAPDSFKECLTASKVARNIAAGVKLACPDCTIKSIPIADGGEGTVDALVEATGGHVLEVDSVDGLMRPIRSFFGVLGDKKTAVIEMAAASGIGLIHPADRSPMVTSTFGTGLLILHALKRGYKNLIVGLGGSATNDGGMGMAMALGYKFLDKAGNEVEHGGGNLKNIVRIDATRVIPTLKGANIVAACDVTNPLCGLEGSSAVFGPQKGATHAMIEMLDTGLRHFAEIIKNQLGTDIMDIPGSGAAGGLGGGLLAFTPAVLRPGFGIVAEIASLEKHISEADVVFTAEGRIDFQTQFGKTPFGVAQIARKYNKPVIALAGSIGEGAEVLLDKGITAFFSITNKPMTLEESIKLAPGLLKYIASQVIRLL